MAKISVALTTFNEEKNISGCLESVKWADEIVVVDEKSVDRTVANAKKFTKKVFLVDHEPMFHKHKQLALEKCSHEWILQIDADERVTPELKEEILAAIDGPVAAYRIPRKSKIFGKYIMHTGWYPDYQIKLVRKGKAHYPCKSVHEDMAVDGEIGTLKSDLLHEHYFSVEQFIDRMNRYTTDDARNIQEIAWSDAIKYPLDEFLKRFFYWEGYKDGLHGLVLSLLMALNRLVVFAKVWEKQKFWQYGDASFRSEVIIQSKTISHDWWHWVRMTENNLLKKVLLKFHFYEIWS